MPTPLYSMRVPVLQTGAVADLLLSHIHLLLSGVLFLDDQASACAYYREGCFQTPISALVGRAGFEPAVPRLKVVCLTTRLPAHILEIEERFELSPFRARGVADRGLKPLDYSISLWHPRR